MNFEEYEKFVDSKVIKESDPAYTMMRCAMEVVEEYFEYLDDTKNEEEFGDCLFWFTYFKGITEYDLNSYDIEKVTYATGDRIMQMFLKYVKRFYRDKDIDNLQKIKEEIMPSWYFWIQRMSSSYFPSLTLEDVAIKNMNKLKIRYE